MISGKISATSNEYNFVTVRNSGTLADVVVNDTLTVNSQLTTSQNLAVDTLTLEQLTVGTGTAPTSAALFAVTGSTLAITQSNIVCSSSDTTVSGVLVPQQGITVAATFPGSTLTFSRGILTDEIATAAVMAINTTLVSGGSSGPSSFALPLVSTGTYNFTVDWGDDSTSIITAYNQPEGTHTYAVNGFYTLTITGTLTGWVFAGAGDVLKLLDISAWGDLVLDDTGLLANFFQGCANLNISAVTGSPVRAGTTSLSGCFLGCSLLNSPNIGTWDVSAVQNMTKMFNSASAFNANLSSWDTSSVTSMTAMFFDASAFNNGDVSDAGNQPLTFDMSSNSLCSTMFTGAAAFNQLVTFTNSGGVTDLSSMFEYATSFNNGKPTNIGGAPLVLDTVSVTTLFAMFHGCTAFNQKLQFTNTGAAIDFTDMFSGASVFNNGAVTNVGGSALTWNTGALTSTESMFQDAIAFNQTVTFSDVTQVVQCNSMFLNSLAFNNGDITDGGNHSWTWTTPALVAATSMFDGASSFNQTVSFSNLGASAASMFNYATRFNNGDTANGGAKPFALNSTSASTSLDAMFVGCSSFNQTVSFTGLTAVNAVASMFAEATRFNNGNPTNTAGKPFIFGVADPTLTSVAGMFVNCSSFNQTVTFPDFSGITLSANMFFNASVFNNGDLTNVGANAITWATSSLQLCNNMFQNAVAFNQRLSFTDMSNVTDAAGMLRGCTAFNNGDITNVSAKPLAWTTTALSITNNMFKNCTSFNQALTFSDMSNMTSAVNMLNACDVFKQNSLSTWTVTACTSFTNFYTGDLNQPDSATSQANYDALLIAWAAQALQTGVTLDMGITKYSAAAVAARATLTATFGWTVNDGGLAP
jgi:surface protein